MTSSNNRNLPDPSTSQIAEAWRLIRQLAWNNETEDRIVWLAHKSGCFTIKSAWEAREKRPHVCWNKLIWGQNRNPRYNFVAWLALQGKLTTKTRLYKWGICPDNKCVLCKSRDETVEHLFFSCKFSMVVWKGIMGNVQICRDSFSWRREVSWLVRKANGRSIYVG
ncbi:hypothetical protein ACFE04_012634 [Oxalis oulophora]